MEQLYHCPVCGWLGLDEESIEPYGTHEICGCCGIQLGYEVSNERGAALQREAWLQHGAPWADEEIEPADWSVELAKQQIREFLAKKEAGTKDGQ